MTHIIVQDKTLFLWLRKGKRNEGGKKEAKEGRKEGRKERKKGKKKAKSIKVTVCIISVSFKLRWEN